jgi:heptosyltransferase-3
MMAIYIILTTEHTLILFFKGKLLHILINRTDAIGDTILTLPMASAIRAKFPQAKVTFLSTKKCLDLFKHHPEVEEVWSLEDFGILRPSKISYLEGLKLTSKLKNKIKEKNISAYFYLGGSHWPSFSAYCAGILIRGGLISRWPSLLWLNQGVRQSRSEMDQHELMMNLQLLSPLGISPNVASWRPENKLFLEVAETRIHWSQIHEEIAQQEKVLCPQFMVIHPGMTGHSLNWPAQNYARFILKIFKHQDDISFVISFTPSDKYYVDQVMAELNIFENVNLKKRIIFFDGAKLGLRAYMVLLSKASFYLGPSTGPTHIACALGTPFVTIYSPKKAQRAKRWKPWEIHAGQGVVLSPELSELEKDLINNSEIDDVMSRVTVDQVFDAYLKVTKLPSQIIPKQNHT